MGEFTSELSKNVQYKSHRWGGWRKGNEIHTAVAKSKEVKAKQNKTKRVIFTLYVEHFGTVKRWYVNKEGGIGRSAGSIT